MTYWMNRSTRWGVALVLLTSAACAPEIGSEAWCERLEEQPRGDWTVNEAADYARHCVFN